MASGIMYILTWWFWITCIGLIAFPLTFRFFKRFPDNGYFLTKIVGLCLASYFNWLLCSLHIIPFSRISVFVSIFLLGILSFLFNKNSFKMIFLFFKENKKIVFLIEFLFLGLFIAFGIIRMCNPDIASTEKLPDFAFLTGILNSHYFPPQDPWFSGASINYFYYGHYHIAFLTKLSGIAPEYTFNLGIALLFALTFVTASGVTFGLVRKVSYAILGGAFVALIGNLDGMIQLLSQIKKVLAGTASLTPINWFNWWMSSRVIVREGIDITINEFPFWSYILGDLHAHVNVVPFSLLVLAILLHYFLGSDSDLEFSSNKKEFFFRIAMTSVALGVIPTANTWDLPTYFSLTVMALILTRYFGKFPKKERSIGAIIGGTISNVLKSIIFLRKKKVEDDFYSFKDTFNYLLKVGIIIVTSIVLYGPFYLHFKSSGTQGVHLVNAIQRTLAGDFLTIYGFFFYCLGAFVLIHIWNRFQKIVQRLRLLTVMMYVLGFFVVYMVFDRFMIAVCLLLTVFLLQIRIDMSDEEERRKFFALALFLVVLFILLGCEFFYIKDAYGRTLERQNTIFKFYYQAWIFCGISAAFAVYWIRERSKSTIANWWEPGYRLLLVSACVFPIIGTSVKCNGFKALTNPNSYTKPTLEGIWYMSWRYPDDYNVIQYLKKHADVSAGVVEATGPAFSHYGRISSATGLRTILGWANHENIWRDGTWKLVNERVQDIKKIYESHDPGEVEKLLKKYNMDYVYVGNLEREHYPNGDFDKFRKFMDVVFKTKDSKGETSYLYRLKNK